jgi:hypothetical protein
VSIQQFPLLKVPIRPIRSPIVSLFPKRKSLVSIRYLGASIFSNVALGTPVFAKWIQALLILSANILIKLNFLFLQR